MTREEAANIMSQMIKDEEGFLSDNTVEAHKMAIRSLEAWEKVNKEIDKQHVWLMQTNHTLHDIDIAFDAIKQSVDKHLSEVEVSNATDQDPTH